MTQKQKPISAIRGIFHPGKKNPVKYTLASKTIIGLLIGGVAAMLIVISGCVSTHGPAVRQPAVAISLQDRINRLAKSGISGVVLQNMVMVMARCVGIAPWNRPYCFNGIEDCYGYCRQVWNAILADGSPHTEDYYPHPYNQRRWLDLPGGLPVNDYPDPDWIHFSDPGVLVPGDLLATAQGYFWMIPNGPGWHGGIYAGNGRNWDSSHLNGLNGAYLRPLFKGFHYYYKPLHDALIAAPRVVRH